jgi:TRAP-type C4-dicarboxylate transport system permease small subunit
MLARLLDGLRRVNRAVALLAGLALFGCGAFIIAEIVLRQAGASMGGSDEIAGYVMAGATAWGLGFGLTERAHVRIDLIRIRLSGIGGALLDLLSLAALAFVAVVIAVRGWPVLERSLVNDSRANTPLETPLWIPQAIWWSGMVWFAAVATVLLLLAAAALATGRPGDAARAIGPVGEREVVE